MNSPVVETNGWVTDKNTPIRIVDIVDRALISERLGVTRQAVGNWAIHRDKTGFPSPIFGTDGVRSPVVIIDGIRRRPNQGNSPCIYYWPDILAWFEQWSKRKSVGGRPHAHRER